MFPDVDADLLHRVELAMVNRLKSIANPFFEDPALGPRCRHRPPKAYRTVLIALRPILARIAEEPRHGAS